MASTRRAARSLPAVPVNKGPNRVTQEGSSLHAAKSGPGSRAASVIGLPSLAACMARAKGAVLDGSFRPDDFGKHNR